MRSGSDNVQEKSPVLTLSLPLSPWKRLKCAENIQTMVDRVIVALAQEAGARARGLGVGGGAPRGGWVRGREAVAVGAGGGGGGGQEEVKNKL